MKKIKPYIFIVIAFFFLVILVSNYYKPVLVSKKQTDSLENQNIKEKTEDITPKTASFLISGDNLIHENILNEANRKAGGNGERSDYSSGFDFLPLYKSIKNEIQSADFSLCNQASIIGANDAAESLSGYPRFNSPQKLADDLIELGFDGFNFANNHLVDMGEDGLARAIRYWKKKNVAAFGLYENSDEFFDIQNKIVEVNGIRIGFLSYTASTNVLYYGNRCVIPYYTVNNTAIQKERIKSQIQALKPEVDLLIVLVNWGNGEGFEPSDHQIEAAKCFAEFGADLIVGTGPKVIQKVETIQPEGQDRSVICAYSLGNMMGTMEYMQNLLGGVVTFDVYKEENGAEIRNFMFIPTIIHYDLELKNILVYKLSDYTNELHEMHGSNLRKGFGKYEWLFETVENTIPKEYLPATLRG